MDVGTYIVEFTNTSYNMQDITFIIKDIPLDPDTKMKLTAATKLEAIERQSDEQGVFSAKIDKDKISEEEFRMYHTLDKAY